MPIDCYAWAVTHVGKVRRHNEDRCVVGGWNSGSANEAWSGDLDRKRPWVLVADGMGGHDAGEVASEVALSAISQRLARVVSTEDALEILDQANVRVHEAMHSSVGRPRMGTTIVGMLAVAERILIFNVGDSRAYRFADGTLARLTVDHSIGDPSGKSTWLTQSLGGTSQRRALLPSVVWTTPEDGLTLLLCTDGLTNLIQDDEIANLLQRHASNPAEALVEAALEAGGDDNVTAVVVSVRKRR